MIFEVVPCAAARIERRHVLRCYVRVVEHLTVGRRRRSAFGRTHHVSLVASSARRLAVILYIGRYLRVLAVCVGAVCRARIAFVTRCCDPYRTVVLAAVTYAEIACRAVVLCIRLVACAQMMRIVVGRVLVVAAVAVGIVLDRQLEPAGAIYRSVGVGRRIGVGIRVWIGIRVWGRIGVGIRIRIGIGIASPSLLCRKALDGECPRFAYGTHEGAAFVSGPLCQIVETADYSARLGYRYPFEIDVGCSAYAEAHLVDGLHIACVDNGRKRRRSRRYGTDLE